MESIYLCPLSGHDQTFFVFFVVVVFFKINLVKTGIDHPAGVWTYLSECCVLTLLCIYVDLLIFIHISSLNIKLTASI